ncbi:MAG: hypothetical protein WBO34_02845 [Gammaproteobacteria bacterium]
MRLFVLLLVLLGGVGIYLYFFPESGVRVLDSLQNAGFSEKTDRIYKWRNDRGEWQLTDSPPPPGVNYELTDYREDVNVLPVPPGIAEE